MFNWYNFEPNDTIFFRGSEPMMMGESHDANFNFPPPAQTLSGAIRTYFYKIDREKYKDIIKLGEEKGGFNLAGPLFRQGKKLYVPAPYSWFAESGEKDAEHNCRNIVKPAKLKSELIKSSSNNLLWAKGGSTLSPLGGKWICSDDLEKTESVELKETEDFFFSEFRTGIALEENKTVRKSHIYSFNHCRLKKGVSIIFGIDTDKMGENGILMLGAEQRFGRFTKENFQIDLSGSGDEFISLSQIEGNEETNCAVVATGNIQYLGGWDLHRGFHKPMKGYFPAGTVFNTKFNNCLGIDLL